MLNKKTFPYESTVFYLFFNKIKTSLKPSLSIALYLLISFNLVATESFHSTTSKITAPTALNTTGPVSFAYGTYYGSSINNNFNDIKVDNTGNIYAFGTTISQGFDAVLAKFDSNGTLLWERLIGGSDADNNHPDNNFDYGKITLDDAGNCYLTGVTSSDNFPLVNAIQNSRAGGTDAFIAKYDPDGNLLFSSYLGGSENENDFGAGAVAVDQNGNIFITGTTKSSNFFNTSSAFQNTLSSIDEPDIFVVKISPDFSTVNGTYWGDENLDVARAIELASDGTVWIGGYSENSTLPLPGQNTAAFDAKDGLLLAFNNALSQLTGGTFYGGIFDDEINDLTLDASNNIYITGSTFSTSDFPTANAFQSFYQGGQMAFMAKYSGSGNLTISTFLGGSQNESGNGISINDQGDIFVVGTTSSDDFPFHRSAQETYNNWNCNYDGFVFKFNADGTRDWGTAYGGWRGDDPKSVTVNSSGQVVVVGKTNSTDLPTSMGANQEDAAFAGVNAFLAIFEVACPSIPIIIHSTENAIYYDQFWCSRPEVPSRPHFLSDTCALQLIAPPGYTNYEWTLNNSTYQTGQIISARNPGSSTNHFYTLTVNDGNNCSDGSISNPVQPDWVRPMCGFGSSFNEDELPHKANILEGHTNEFYCVGEPINYPLSSDGFCGSTWQWQKDFMDLPNETNENYTVTEPGCYRIAITNNFTGCTVYSTSKQFILLDSIRLNSREDTRNCFAETSVDGCTNVELQARINTCVGCYSAPGGLTYEFYLDGALHRSSTSSRLTTTTPGDYQVRVMYNGCEISSNTTSVEIRPTESPTWVLPVPRPTCITDLDSLTWAVSHPAVSDSASMYFNFPHPMTDIVSYDSMVTAKDLNAGCLFVNLTRQDGCTSRSENIELHDNLLDLKIEMNGPGCIPVRMDIDNLGSCEMDSIFWYKGDTLVYDRNYMARYTANEPGSYFAKIKNACGEFFSDTVLIRGNLPTANISPVGPVCLPANISLDFPNPDSSIVIKWYRLNSQSGCSQSASNLIPNQNGINLVAGLPGYYFAVLQDTISGCKSLCTDKVEVQRSVAGAGILPGNDIYFCDGNGGSNQTFTVTPSSPSFTYQWYRNSNPISGATNPSYTTNQQGVYRVYLENSCDNSFTPTVSVYDIANPVVTIANPDTIYLCGPDTISLLAQSDQPILFQWFKDDLEILDAVDSILLTPSAGKYQVFGKNNNSQCEDYSREIYLINSVPMNVNVTMNPACDDPCGGSLSANVTGGVPFSGNTYNYQWSNGSNNQTISNLCIENYSLTVTDNVGCNTFSTTSVTSGFTLSATIDSINCFGENTGKIQLNVQGGINPFSYTWNTGITDATITNLSTGNYQVTVTDGSNCSSVTNYTLSAPTELNMNLLATDATCFGANNGNIQTATLGGTLPHILTWNTAVHPDSSNLNPGWYRVTLTDQNSCQLVDSIEVLEPIALQISLQITNTLDCPGSTDGAIGSSVMGGTAPYTYLWNQGSTTSNLNNISSDTFSLTVTDQQSCQSTAEIILTAAQNFEIIIEEKQAINCHGTATGSIKPMVQGGTAPIQLFLDGNPINNAELENLTAGTYNIHAVDFNNCSTVVLPVVLTEPNLIQTSAMIDSIACHGSGTGRVALSTIGGIGNYTYLWDNGLTTTLVDTLSAGDYAITISDSLSCEEIITITVLEPLAIATNFSIKNVDCFQESNGNVNGVSTTGGTAPYRYFLEGENLPVGNQQLDSLFAGNYRLITLDGNDCELIQDIEITEPDLFVANIEIQDTLKCKGGMDGQLKVIPIGGTAPYTFEWFDGTNNSEKGNLSTGTYRVTVTDQHQCTTTALLTLPDGPSLNLSIILDRDPTCFGFTNGQIEMEALGGTAPFTYFLNQINNNVGSFTDLSSGDYNIRITDNNNCLSETIVVTLDDPLPLSLSVNLDSVECIGTSTGTAMIVASGGTENYSYNWNNGLNERSSDTLSVGNYRVTVTDALACNEVINFTILEPTTLLTSFLRASVSCNGGNNGSLNNIITTGGTAPYTYYLAGNNLPPLHQVFDSLRAGTYTLITQDANNCERIDTAVITEPTLLTTSIQIVDSLLCFGAMNGQLEAITTGGSGAYTWIWNNGNTTATNDNLATGVYSVTITDSLDCEANKQLILPDGPFLDIEITTQKNLSCLGSDDGLIRVQANGGTPPFRYFINQDSSETGAFENLATGIYSIYAQDRNNCISETRRIEITAPDLLSATVSTSPVLCPDGISGRALISPNGGTTPYFYLWNNELTTAGSVELRAGEYEVTITDSQDCTTSINFTISQPDPIIHDLEIEHANCFSGNDGSFLINSSTGGTPTYEYYLNDLLLDNTDLFEDSLSAGSYNLKTIDQQGCTHLEIVTIQEPSPMKVDMGADQTIVLGQSTTIPIEFLGGYDTLRYQITPNNYLDCSQANYYNCSNPKVTQPLTDIKYEIVLTDGHGCSAEDELLITVAPADHFIYLGNAFNPFSLSGNETYFVQATPVVAKIKSFKIFNRWGAPVFTQSNFLPNDKAFGWKGDFKGELVNTGVFIYQVVFETIAGEEMQQTGDVTVVW